MTYDKKTQNWYSIVSSSPKIWQGDLLDGFRVPSIKSIKKKGNKTVCNYTFFEMDAVVISQSCDLVTKAQDGDQVVLCPRHFLANAYQNQNDLKGDWSKLIKNQVVDKLLLNKFDNNKELGFGYSFVNLSKIYVAPYNYVSEFANSLKNRVRMESPYRERLSQAFAGKYMRVGLPIDITRDVPNIEFNPVSTYGQEIS